MPELPEVETIVRSIKSLPIIGQSIVDCWLSGQRLRLMHAAGMEQRVIGGVISAVSRRAKYILISLIAGKQQRTLVVHLGMSGRLFHTTNSSLQKHDHCQLQLANGYYLTYNDPRRFGMVVDIDTAELSKHQMFGNLGPEPLTKQFNAAFLQRQIQRRGCSIKAAIMDAAVVVGVGNIYASESLFMAGVHPLRPANSLHLAECEILVASIKKVLRQAISAGGSTLSSYSDVNGKIGNFQNSFQVYSRHAKACYVCGGPIASFKISGRSTFCCPTCQPLS